MEILFAVVAIVVLPIAWLMSEFSSYVSLRVLLGCLTLIALPLCAWAMGTALAQIDMNAAYGAATRDLIQNTILQLEADNDEQVLTELKRLRNQYDPSYETRSGYEQLVEDYVVSFGDAAVRHDAGKPGWVATPGGPHGLPR